MAWKVCAEEVVSVAMRVESMGYGLHGHDVRVSVCACYEGREGHADLERLRALLREALGSVDHRALWEAVGGEGTLEDLLEYVVRRLGAAGVRVCEAAARVPSGWVELAL